MQQQKRRDVLKGFGAAPNPAQPHNRLDREYLDRGLPQPAAHGGCVPFRIGATRWPAAMMNTDHPTTMKIPLDARAPRAARTPRLGSNQGRKLAAAAFTLCFNLLPGFGLRAAVMRLFGFQIGRCVALHSWLRFFDTRRNIAIGSNVTINPGCYLDNRLPISIGNNVNISHDVKIYTLGHDVDDPMCRAIGAPVTIRDDAWIFPNVLIMPGVTIGRGAVVYPGSVVTRDVGDLDIVGGNPARRIRKRKADIRYRVDYRVWFAR